MYPPEIIQKILTYVTDDQTYISLYLISEFRPFLVGHIFLFKVGDPKTYKKNSTFHYQLHTNLTQLEACNIYKKNCFGRHRCNLRKKAKTNDCKSRNNCFRINIESFGNVLIPFAKKVKFITLHLSYWMIHLFEKKLKNFIGFLVSNNSKVRISIDTSYYWENQTRFKIIYTLIKYKCLHVL